MGPKVNLEWPLEEEIGLPCALHISPPNPNMGVELGGGDFESRCHGELMSAFADIKLNFNY